MKVLIRAWRAESLSQMEVWNSAIALGRREFLCLSLWTVCPCVCTAGPVAGGESGQGSPEQTAVWVTHSIKHRGSDATPRHALTALCLSFKCCACGGGIRSLFFSSEEGRGGKELPSTLNGLCDEEASVSHTHLRSDYQMLTILSARSPTKLDLFTGWL